MPEPPPRNQGADPRFAYSQNPNSAQFPNGANKQPSMMPIVLFSLLGVGAFIFIAYVMYIGFFSASITAEGKDCKSAAEVSRQNVEVDGLNEIIERSHECEFVDGRQIRISKDDYNNLGDLLVKDLKGQSKAAKEGLVSDCRRFGYDIGVDYVSDGLIVGEYVFLLHGSSYSTEYYFEILEEEEISAELAGNLCDKLAEHLEVPSPADLRNLHSSLGGNFLPILAIPAADYVFLKGINITPSKYDFGSDCWSIKYEIAFKGEWSEQSMEDIFDNDDLYEAIKNGVFLLYPDENSSTGFSIDLIVYKYNGSTDGYDYRETPSKDIREYSRFDCR